MTFSGLPSLRDPKHSLKNSNSGSSVSSSPNSSPSSSPTTEPISGLQQQHQQGGPAVLGTADHPTVNVASPSTTTTSAVEVVRPAVTGSSSGAAMISVAVANVPTETTSIPTSLIERSFQGLIQSSFGHVLNSLPPQGMAASLNSMSNPSTMDLHQQQVQSPSPVSMLLPPMTASPTPIVTMKKATPQSLSPAHSAAYRKRLNVNQVCDWCRYRKIRCDRESPCNSCQHSKRECIRTPPSALLANQLQTPTEDQEPIVSSPASSSGKTKRVRAANKDGRSRRASKSYRGSSISSHHSSSYTSLSSDNDGSDEEDEDEGEDEQKSTSGSRVGESSVSPVVGSLTLAGLGFSSLGLGLGSFGSNLGLDARRGSDFHMASPTPFDSSMAAVQESAMPQQMSLQDQEHLERMQRIEMLLSNVIPGAAEFITGGSQGSLHVQQQHHQHLMQQQQQQQQRRTSVVKKKDLSLLTQNLDLHEQQSQHDRILSPQDRLAKMALSSPAINTAMSMPWSSSPSGLSSLCEKTESTEPSQSSSSSSSLPLMSGSDYIERMKKIEMLLGTIQDVPLAKALISQSEGQTLSSGSSRSNSVDVADNTMLSKKVSKRNLKKKGRGYGKKSNYNSDGTIIKRPHVAAGFAGQKPPPKLPQAIAEAAQKKQATRKKRVSAAAAAKAAAAAAVAASASADTTATRSETNDVSSPLSSVSMPMGASSLSTVQGANGVKMDSRMMTISTMASLDIPSTFDNESSSSSSFAHQRQQQQQQQLRMLNIQQHQQHQHRLQMAQHRNSISFQSQSQLFNSYQQQQQHQQLPMSGTSSMNIPIADSTSSYGSLVVPASSSTSSSPSSSPSISRATVIGQDNSMRMAGQQHLQPPQQQHISFHQTQLSGDFEMGFDMRQGMSSDSVLQATNDTHIHPFTHSDQQQQQQQQQQHQRQSIQIDQDGFADFGLNMDESLEGLMKKSMGSFDRLMESFSNDSPSLLEHHHQLHQQQQQQQVLAPSTPAASVDQFSYFQNLQQTPTPQQQQQQFLHNQQHQQQGQQQQQQQQGHMSFQEVSRMMWISNHSGGAASFSVPTNSEFSWSSPPPHQQTPLQALSKQQGTMQSINISANDSPQEELELELGLENHHVVQQQQQQQQQLSAHMLFQQQHQEQQRRHIEQQKQQHRASIQHQHQQTFYIPQMQDDEDEDDEDESNGGLPDHV